MSRKEFLDRWNRMPGLKHAELIDGTVYAPSPLSDPHAGYDNLLGFLFCYYSSLVPGCRPLSNATWLMTSRSAPQPDQCLCWTGPGTRSRLVNKLRTGVPDLVAEVCRSSRSYDLGPKLRLYEAAGVPEYVALILEDERIEWRVLERGRYRMMKPHRDGTYRSNVFPGLWLDERAFWKEDPAALMAAVDRGTVNR